MKGLNETDLEGTHPRTPTGLSRKPFLARDRRTLLIGLAFGLLVLGLAWYRHASYRSRIFDLAEFDQALWLMAHGHVPVASVIGRNIFAVHFSLALVVFVPLSLVAASPIWLLAAQAIALAIGFLALGPLLDEVGVTNKSWRASLMLSYVASPFVWNAALFDFHASTLAVPFLMVGITAALRDDTRRLALMSLGLVLVLDSLGLAVAAIGLVGFTTSNHRQVRAALALAEVAWAIAIGRLGHNVSSPELWQAHYGYLGSSLGAALGHPWHAVVRTGREILAPENMKTIVAWLAPLAFLPLLSPEGWCSGSSGRFRSWLRPCSRPGPSAPTTTG